MCKKERMEKFINDNESLIELKLKTNQLASLLSEEEDFYKISGRMKESGRFIKTSNQNGRVRIIDSNSSKIRYEPYSNQIARRRIYAQFFNNLPQVINEHPSHEWYFMTLTTKDCNVLEVRKTLDILNTSFKKLLTGDKFSRYFKQNGQDYGKCGYFKILEISDTEYSNEICRPHVHVLLHLPKNSTYSKNYISNEKLKILWLKALNMEDNYKITVDMQKIDFDDIHEQIINLCNVGSYMMKHNSIDLLKDKDFTCEYLKQIRGKNLHSSSGTLKYINKNNSNYQRPEENKNNINILKFNDYSSKYKLVTP
jgi:hypothetical protein